MGAPHPFASFANGWESTNPINRTNARTRKSPGFLRIHHPWRVFCVNDGIQINHKRGCPIHSRLLRMGGKARTQSTEPMPRLERVRAFCGYPILGASFASTMGYRSTTYGCAPSIRVFCEWVRMHEPNQPNQSPDSKESGLFAARLTRSSAVEHRCSVVNAIATKIATNSTRISYFNVRALEFELQHHSGATFSKCHLRSVS